MLQLMREGCSSTYPPLSIARYSFIQLSELEQCRVNKLVQGFNTAVQDSKSGSRSRESEGLPLSHCTCMNVYRYLEPFWITTAPTMWWVSSNDNHVCYNHRMFLWFRKLMRPPEISENVNLSYLTGVKYDTN